MKAIMYHYVRESQKNLPFFRYLHFRNFKKQLDFFEKNYTFLRYEEFLNLYKNPPQNQQEFAPYEGKILLTFDDGLKDHYDFVLPELKRRGLFGFFFVCTGVYEKQKALDVHRIHFLLGLLGGEEAFMQAKEKIAEFEKQRGQSIIKKEEKNFFESKTYLNQDNDFYTMEFKKLFNYYIKYDFREALLDSIVSQNCSDEEIFKRFYVSLDELRDMQKAGMIIGSHSQNHLVFSKLLKEEQERELKDSFEFLEKAFSSGGGGG